MLLEDEEEPKSALRKGIVGIDARSVVVRYRLVGKLETLGRVRLEMV